MEKGNRGVGGEKEAACVWLWEAKRRRCSGAKGKKVDTCNMRETVGKIEVKL